MSDPRRQQERSQTLPDLGMQALRETLGASIPAEAQTDAEENEIIFHTAEVETIHKVLDRIDQIATKRRNEGFNETNFTIGVLNCLLTVYIFGKYPQHFWLFYLVQGFYLIPGRVYYSWTRKPLNEVLYYVDYCWVMNMIGGSILLYILPAWTVSHEVRRQLYITALGVACGPLLGASATLPFVAVLFHDTVAMGGLFIHILPPMLTYTFMWHTDAIHKAWPELFKLDYFDDLQFFPDDTYFVIPGTGLGTIAGNTIALYFMWFIPYVSWMLLIGLDLPRKNRKNKDGSVVVPKYDTVFHATVRGGFCATMGSALWDRPRSVSQQQMENDDYEVRDFIVYMGLHAFFINLAVYTLAYPCYRSQNAHKILLILITVICVKRGAQRYTYYSTNMYGRMVRKDFADLLGEATPGKK